jgi:hypothetical protein
VAIGSETENRKRNLYSIGMETPRYRVFRELIQEDLGKDWLARTAGKMRKHVLGRETGKTSECSECRRVQNGGGRAEREEFCCQQLEEN